MFSVSAAYKYNVVVRVYLSIYTLRILMEKIKILLALILAIVIVSPLPKEKNNFTKKENYSIEFVKNSSVDRKAAESVVLIEVILNIPGSERVVGSATGFSVFYDKKENASYFMTNNHVCDNEIPSFYMSYVKNTDVIPSYYSEKRPLEIIAKDPSNDLCLLKAYNEKIKPLKIKSSKTLKNMDDVYSIGAPGGIYPIWISGKFSGYIDRKIEPLGLNVIGNDFMLISGIVVSGQSGSPVYDSTGSVVGIIFASLGKYGGVAVPGETIKEFIKESIK